MFDSFPVDQWSDDVAEFWTWGGGDSAGTWIQLVIGFSVMLIAFYGFVMLEKRKLARQAAALRAARPRGPPPGYQVPAPTTTPQGPTIIESP